jgi:carboxyl-terminal processing protease
LTLVDAAIALEKASAEKGRPRENFYDQVALFADAVNIIRSEYVDEVDSKRLIYGALKGMLESLDDYSQFMNPDEYNEIRLETKGEFGGVGVEISLKDGILTVITPMIGTPAETAGVRSGDKIVKIDGNITKNITLSEAVKRMRGKPGSTVTLTVWREGASNILDIPIKRDIIKIHSIERAEMIADKVGYIKLVEFQQNTARDLDNAAKRLKDQRMDSLILDLRNNPGGLLEGALDVAERFLEKGKTIVSIRARDKKQSITFRSSGRFADTDFPLIVIVNEGSASASEIVAGAIKDNGRGMIVGVRTYGKGSVQTVIPLRDGSALRFTTAYYLSPSGNLIKDKGIVPDVAVESSIAADKGSSKADVFDEILNGKERPPIKREQKKEAAVKRHPEADNQLDSAIELMRTIKTRGKSGGVIKSLTEPVIASPEGAKQSRRL